MEFGEFTIYNLPNFYNRRKGLIEDLEHLTEKVKHHDDKLHEIRVELRAARGNARVQRLLSDLHRREQTVRLLNVRVQECMHELRIVVSQIISEEKQNLDTLNTVLYR